MKRKFLHRKVKAVVFPLVILFVVFSLAILGFAYRPPNPVMNYVPQDIGIYDTYYSNLAADDCRACHGDRNAVAKRHQYSASAFADCPDGRLIPYPNCLSACHTDTGNPQNITYDCLVCHIENNTELKVCSESYYIFCDTNEDCPSGETCVPGDFGYPHHKSDLADSGQCTACHEPDLLVETQSVKTPYYYPKPYTSVPSPFTCENCHWPSGNTPHTPPPEWPKPIEANGPIIIGVRHPSKPYTPDNGTHHEIDGLVLPKCYNCHSNGPYLDLDPDNPLLIRYCENCHSIDSLHGIQEHVTAGHGLTANEKCIACHGDMPDTPPPSGTESPAITDISPKYGPEGTTLAIYGKNFDSSPGSVLLNARIGDDQTYSIPPVTCSWTDNAITCPIPLGLSARNYNVRVETANGISNMRVYTLTGTQPDIPCPTQTPVISSIEYTVGAGNALMTIQGQDFGQRWKGNQVLEGELDENQATGCGNGDGICDPSENITVEPIGDGLGNDDCVCDPTELAAGYCAPGCYVSWFGAPIYSWTDNKIDFRVFSGAIFSPGTIHVKVKNENGESNQVAFLLRKHPTITSLAHPDPATLTLSGEGFGDNRVYVQPDGYGWESTVTFNRPDETISTSSGNIISWSDTEIQLTLPDIQADFYGVTIETRYFHDTDGNGGYTSEVDELYQTVASDPLPLYPVECELVPDETIIPRGGTLGFQITVTNYLNKYGFVRFATDVVKPNGLKLPPSGYLIGPLQVNLGPHGTKSGHKSHVVPEDAPLGTYTYRGYVGRSDVIYHKCQFKFKVTAQ
jgi:hypothetical protein